MRVPCRRFFVVAAAAFGFASLCAQPCLAGAGGSKHDFRGAATISEGKGVCTSCHIAHGSPESTVLWKRGLTDERSDFSRTSDPNYVAGDTLLCYDCHANPNVVDNVPPDSSFDTNRVPQDVAFDQDMKIPAMPAARDGSGAATDGKPGYYENVPSGTYLPSGGATKISGHYVKNDPGVGSIDMWDKLPCGDCHNPHDSSNQAFIRSTLRYGAGYLTGVKASTKMTYPFDPPSGTVARDDADSRKFCIACHGTWEQSTYKAVRFSEINPSYGSNFIQTPPNIGGFHGESGTTACTACHAHNLIVVSCTDCHGFPPTSGAHQRHKDALGAAFDCAICHGPDPGSASWHNHNNGTVIASEVDVMGKTSWWGSGGNYYGVDGGETLPSGYAFEKKGGGDGVCANLACHGYPAATSGDAGALNWSGDDMVNDATGAAVDIEICVWCHDATPAVIDKDGDGATYGAVKAPNAMGNGTTWGAEVNGHGKTSGNYDADSVGGGGGAAAANKGCVVCHDATYTAGTGPDKAHFDGSYTSAEKRLNDSINSVTLSGAIPTNGVLADAACIACHQNGMGTQVSSHGNHYNGSIETAAFQRECRACHEPHGRNWNGSVPDGGTNGRNLHMVGKWVDSTSTGTWGTADAGEEARVDSNATGGAVAITPADAKVVFTANSGENSYDDGFDDSLHESVCVVCHADLVNDHNEAGSTTLRTDSGTHNPLGSDCMTCHDHDFDNSVATAYDAFGGSGGPDMEQFFDAASTGTNYNAVSGHALNITSLAYAIPPDCIGCHQTSGGTGVSNECLKCHYEGYVSGGTAWVWSGHANGSHMLELRTAASGDPPYTAACNPSGGSPNCIRIPRQSTNVDADGTDDVYTHCLTCHDGSRATAPYQLGAQNPPDMVPAGTSWDAGVGHGNSTTLSNERVTGGFNAGPPDYDCGACHSSTQPASVGEEIPSYHASVNFKLVANTTAYATPEYDTTVEKNSWCATRCHRTDGSGSAKDNNADNSIAKDNNVIDHFWAPDSSETADQTDCPMGAVDPNGVLCETHPSYKTIVEGTLYQVPPGLPYDTGTKQFTCGTCHEPHGNGIHTDSSVQMMRLNFTDGTLCNQCHK